MHKRIKKKIDFWIERYNQRSEYLSECKKNLSKVTAEYETLKELTFGERTHKVLDTYEKDGVSHIVYIHDFCHTDDCCFTMSFISKSTFSHCENTAQANVAINEVYQLEIVNIHAFEVRKGHGSILLNYIERYCRANEIPRIYGRLDEKTFIGLPNLINFYVKNSFKICETKRGMYFKKIL